MICVLRLHDIALQDRILFACGRRESNISMISNATTNEIELGLTLKFECVGGVRGFMTSPCSHFATLFLKSERRACFTDPDAFFV